MIEKRLARSPEVEEASLENLLDVFEGAHDKVDKALVDAPDWDTVWEIHDRIHTMSSEDGDFTRSRLFRFIRHQPAPDFSQEEVESLAILFQAIGEQETRWKLERTTRVLSGVS